MKDNLPNPSNAHRIRALEKDSKRETRDSDSIAIPSDVLRPAQVIGPVDKGDDEDSETLIEVVWLDVREVSGEMEYTERSATAQAQVAVLEGALPEPDTRGVCAKIKGRWVWVSNGADPDTPFRQTVEHNVAGLWRGASAPVFADLTSLDLENLDPHTLHLHVTGGPGAAPSGWASLDEFEHDKAIRAGTLSFFNEFTFPDESLPVDKMTSNGGFCPAIIQMTHENHEYAMPNGRRSASNRHLISVPYGPYRIVGKKDIPINGEAPTTYPRFVYAVIKTQVRDRSISIWKVKSIEASPGSSIPHPVILEPENYIPNRDLEYFPELYVGSYAGSTLDNALIRRDYKSSSPNCFYLFDFFLSSRSTRTDPSEVTVGGNTFYEFDSDDVILRVQGANPSNTNGPSIGSGKIYFSQKFSASSSTVDAWFARVTGMWISIDEAIRFFVHQSSKINFQSSDVTGWCIIHRLGERGSRALTLPHSSIGGILPEIPGYLEPEPEPQ